MLAKSALPTPTIITDNGNPDASTILSTVSSIFIYYQRNNNKININNNNENNLRISLITPSVKINKMKYFCAVWVIAWLAIKLAALRIYNNNKNVLE